MMVLEWISAACFQLDGVCDGAALARFGQRVGWFCLGAAFTSWFLVVRVTSPGMRMRADLASATTRSIGIHFCIVRAIHCLRRAQAGEAVTDAEVAELEAAVAKIEAWQNDFLKPKPQTKGNA